MALWEVFLSPFLQVLFDKLASGEVADFLRKRNIDQGLIEKLRTAYLSCAAVINEAERSHRSPEAEDWMRRLKDAVYEAEDVLDALATEAQLRQSNIASRLNPLAEHPNTVMCRLVTKMEEIAGQKHGESHQAFQRVSSTSFLSVPLVHGREKDLEAVIRLLTENEPGTADISIVPLVGVGGIGKTTLAQYVFNDGRVKACFDVRTWAFVSEKFDVVSITRAILESCSGTQWSVINLELLQTYLRRRMKRMKFLVVLDDVWDDDLHAWNQLLAPLAVGSRGSRIIVTCRSKLVFPEFMSLPCYQVKELDDEACWNVFLPYAFGRQDPENHRELKAIGKEIVNISKGVPLTAKCLGNMVGSKLDAEHWRSVMNTNLWEFPFSKCGVLPHLLPSYFHLPSILKQCFAYCAVFPKEYAFERRHVVLQWMAQGYLQQNHDGAKSMEEVGEAYFDELVKRSFFRETPGGKSQYIMHDIVNDLAQFVSKGSCVRLEEKRGNRSLAQTAGYHLSLVRGKYDPYRKFQAIERFSRLRTFLPLESASETGYFYLSNKVYNDLLLRLSRLRMLSLCGYFITELPESLGDLIHLRYLDLSHSCIKELPNSISSLYNLQTLLLNDCKFLERLASDIGNLVNLRYLDVSRSTIQEMPTGLDKLGCLQSLPEFFVGANENSRLESLRNLDCLKGRLAITNLENVVDPWDAWKANLAKKKRIDELVLTWSENHDDLRMQRYETKVCEMLRPSQQVNKIVINNYYGSHFPTWVGDPVLVRLISVECHGCKYTEVLPPFGQLPSLKKLVIKGLSNVKVIGNEFYGNANFVSSFPSLETLHLEEMLQLKNWYSSEQEEEDEDEEKLHSFHCLSDLCIRKCPNLRSKLPRNLPSLTKLCIEEAGQLKPPLPLKTKITELRLMGCNEEVVKYGHGLTFLVSLSICNNLFLTHLPGSLLQKLVLLQNLEVDDCLSLLCLWDKEVRQSHVSNLRKLVVRNCPSLQFMWEDEGQLPVNLEYLEIDSCNNLEMMPTSMQNFNSLGVLVIKNCTKIPSFDSAQFPSSLKEIAVQQCSFESMPSAKHQNMDTPLLYMHISCCYNFTNFATDEEHSPTIFNNLVIEQCPNLTCLPLGLLQSNSSLVVLEIINCSSLACFPSSQIPRRLKALTIWDCPSLETLANVEMQEDMLIEYLRIGACAHLQNLPRNLHQLKRLSYLEIDGCPLLVVFPDGGLPVVNLKEVIIFNCENLKCLPHQMQTLTTLRELRISNCPALESPREGGIATNLITLEIKNCRRLSGWGLHNQASLKALTIVDGPGDHSDNFPFPEWFLPPTLTSLHLANILNLKSFSGWIDNLTALENLSIKGCSNLRSLPDNGFPATLCRLEIEDCPHLEKRCEENWNEVDHIPLVVMRKEIVLEPEPTSPVPLENFANVFLDIL